LSSAELQVPWVQESLVQPTPSSQSAAEQHLPQVAEAASLDAQHACPSAHSGLCAHLLAEHESVVHGSLSSQFESEQHSAQPTPGQHSELPPHSVGVWSHSEARHESSVQASLSSQPSLSTHDSLRRQSAVAEQYSVAAHNELFGA
jgi:hypothetical protein